MRTMHPYLNFDGQAEEAFNFYKSVLGGEFAFFKKMSDAPESDKLPENERNRVMHVALPINEHTILMASDCVPSAGHVLREGNNMYVHLAAESREDADKLFNGLSAGGTVEMPMEDMFWGDYFGSFKDKFGIQWMINFGNY
ncbi:MAG: VOC family protein [Pedobacter agri]|uniref:VOC family protein n=1 Tax=Pedobacter agri TaxID=454586 RepID=A0A9X3I920_9SPHI|nr:VOC family protein [Pedobacter agri]MCX3264539.1 VOC family protein [Pedobacter agri]MDQ1140687.1 PhnB protein [Pedobacter agri]